MTRSAAGAADRLSGKSRHPVGENLTRQAKTHSQRAFRALECKTADRSASTCTSA